MNNTYLDQLKHYLENTSKETLEKEYKELAYLNEIGPSVLEYISSINHYSH